MKLYKIHAGGLEKKKISDLHADIRTGINAVSRIANINSTQVGSSAYKKIKHFGDIDLFSLLDPNKIPLFTKQLQKIVRNLPDNFYFSDCKIGGTRVRGRHWTKKQILKGSNKKLKIEEALTHKCITKLDVIIPINTKFGNRMCELTNFFYIPTISAPFSDFVKSMNADIILYHKKNRHLKVLKRKLSKLLWTDRKKDQREIKHIASIISGRAGKISTILADIEVCHLLNKNKKLQKQQLTYLSNLMKRPITMRNLAELERETNSAVNSIVNFSLNK